MKPSPFDELGVSPQDDDETIRLAYLARVKENPPDRKPEKFRRIHEAYEAIKDARARLDHELFHLPELDQLEALSQRLRPRRPTLAQMKKLFAECLKDV